MTSNKNRQELYEITFTSSPIVSLDIFSNVNMTFFNKGLYHNKKSRFHKFSHDSNVKMSTMEKFVV